MTSRVLIVEQEHPADLAVYRAAIAAALPDLEVLTAADPVSALAAAPGCDVLMGKAHNIAAELVRAMPRLAWIQALTTGVDHLETVDLPSSVRVTNARGIHGPQMAELAFLLMLGLIRDYPRLLANQKSATWARWPQRLLFGKTAVIVGVGAISEALAVRCQAFGMHVVGVSSSPRAVTGFDEIVPYAALKEAAARADFLLVLCPYSAATHHLIDADVMAAMRPDAFLVNIARGKVIDEAAMIAALRAGTIAGAGLDVFTVEPLPSDSPLWAMGNVLITPRIGGMSDRYAQQAAPLMVENLRLWLAGGADGLKNLVTITPRVERQTA